VGHGASGDNRSGQHSNRDGEFFHVVFFFLPMSPASHILTRTIAGICRDLEIFGFQNKAVRAFRAPINA
jgi:hypothetical protein